LNGSEQKKPNNKKAVAVRKHDHSSRPEKGNPVMKNLNRARRNSGNKSASAQSATARKTSPGQTPSAAVTVRLVGEIDGAPLNLAESQITDSAYSALAAMADEQRVTLGELISQLIGKEINRRASPFPMTEFEAQRNNLSALLDLFEAKLLAVYDEKADNRSPSYDPETATMVCGYMNLIHAAKKRAKEQFDVVCSFVQAKS
jgi:hypothetical protein